MKLFLIYIFFKKVVVTIWNCLPQYGRVTMHKGDHLKGLH